MLTPVMGRIFDDVLQRDSSAVIVLFLPLQTYPREAMERRLLKNRPLLAGRIRCLPMQEYSAYLRVLHLGDVVLDDVPFNSYDTALIALGIDTPGVTLAGNTTRDQLSCGLHQEIRLAELVADNEADWVALALRLASDAASGTSCRSRIAAGWSTLFEDITAVREIERGWPESPGRFLPGSHQGPCRERRLFRAEKNGHPKVAV